MVEPRFTLRQLPTPARLVVALFLIATGLGYFSALVQLHLQHSGRNGEPLPSANDVVEVFAGVKRYDPATAEVPVSKLEKLVMGPVTGAAWNGSGSMAAAFFEKDDGTYHNEVKDDPAVKPKLDAEREGERLAVKTWIHLADDVRKKAYDADHLPKPVELKAITADYLAGDAVKIKTILKDRCARCHAKDEEQEKYPLETFEQIAKYLDVPKVEAPAPGSWVPSGRLMSVEKLTQSTHAHLLSFAMLFGLTGLAFAFTGFPKGVRLIIAPLVLLAQVLDISCWWLARLPDVGPSFAVAIVGTGAIVGLGLCVQIVGCLFDMFERKGRFVLIVLFVLAAFGGSVLYNRAIEPALQAEKAK